MTYQEYQAKRQEECNALPLFFAFSNEQFKKHMEERGLTENDTDKIYRLGDTGGFYLRSDAALIKEYFQNDKLFELMQDPEFATSAFRFEMDNHEYSINWQGDWDVCSCFSKKELEYGEDKDYRDYLKEAGLENLIPCYINAKQSHYKAFDDVNREPSTVKYWPNAIYLDKNGDPKSLLTYNAVTSTEECNKQFECWKNDYGYFLAFTWIQAETDGKISIQNDKEFLENTGERNGYSIYRIIVEGRGQWYAKPIGKYELKRISYQQAIGNEPIDSNDAMKKSLDRKLLSSKDKGQDAR